MEVQNDPEYAEKTFYTPPIDPEHLALLRKALQQNTEQKRKTLEQVEPYAENNFNQT
jgi:hypothetical protein